MNAMGYAVRNTRTAVEHLVRQGDNSYNPAFLDCIADQLDALGKMRDAAKFRTKADAIRASMSVTAEE